MSRKERINEVLYDLSLFVGSDGNMLDIIVECDMKLKRLDNFIETAKDDLLQVYNTAFRSIETSINHEALMDIREFYNNNYGIVFAESQVKMTFIEVLSALSIWSDEVDITEVDEIEEYREMVYNILGRGIADLGDEVE